MYMRIIGKTAFEKLNFVQASFHNLFSSEALGDKQMIDQYKNPESVLSNETTAVILKRPLRNVTLTCFQ